MLKKGMTILILILLFALISIPLFRKSYEGFSGLTPGVYPISSDVPILYEDYPLKNPMGLSDNTYRDNYPNYPVFGSSYDQITNNVRYWETPDNGKCSTAEFCGGLYSDKNLDIPKTPNSIPFNSPDIRVNYYGSHELSCPANI